MGTKLYVGNLPYGVRDEDLQQVFAPYGSIISAKVMMERDTGRSKGFGFVEMSSENEAQSAIHSMNSQPLGGRSLVVNEARPMEPRAPRSHGGYTGGGGYQGANSGSYAGRNEGSFRSPYGTGPRNRSTASYGNSHDSGGHYRNER